MTKPENRLPENSPGNKEGRFLQIPVTEDLLPPCRFVLDQPLAVGSVLRVRVNCVTMLFNLKVISVLVNGLEMPILRRFSQEECCREFNWHLEVLSLVMVETPVTLPAGNEVGVMLRWHLAEPGVGPLFEKVRYAGLDMAVGLHAAADIHTRDSHPVASDISLRFVAGEPDRLEVWRKPDNLLWIQAFDRFGNPTRKDGPITITDGDRRVEAASGEGATTLMVKPNHRLAASGRISVTDAKGRSAVSTPQPLSIDGNPIFFGEFHWHTKCSADGMRSIEDALRSARDEIGLDFAGPSDHISEDGQYHNRFGITPADQVAICRSFDQPGRFCVIAGAEVGGRYGHANLYADSFELFVNMVSRFKDDLMPAWKRNVYRLPLSELTALCPDGRALVIPHHTNVDSFVGEGVLNSRDNLPYWYAIHWPLPTDRKAVRLVEIVQIRGAFETEETDPVWGVRSGGFGGSVRTALTRGWRLGFVGGTDNHMGWPVRGRGVGCGHWVGLTAVTAPALDTTALFQALYARRCYATTGARIVADATLNGHPPGSELALAPGVERRFRICIRGTAPLDKIQLIHSGCILADLPVPKDSLDFDAEWIDERPGRPLEDAWYYLRVRQTDGHCAWLSPFWVDLA